MSYQSLFEMLEGRALFAAVTPSANEVLLVELINRARANPSAEASRFGIALNEGVPAEDTISTTAKQPLAINPNLTDAARKHSQWMIDNDIFSHTGASGSSPQSRMTSAGYTFGGSYAAGENIAYNGTTGTMNATNGTIQNHQILFVDEDYPDRGHRTNMLSDGYKEIGAGVATGVFNVYNAAMLTEDFARNGTGSFLCGVVYTDGVTNDDFYTVGEGLGGVTITAKNNSTQATTSTTSWDSGGYALALASGTYTITATGGSLGGTVTYNNVVVGSSNVKRDFTPDQAQVDTSFAVVTNGILKVTGTAGVDAISISSAGGSYSVSRNGVIASIATSGVTSIEIYGEDGDDAIFIGSTLMGTYAIGGNGNDYLQGSDSNDTLSGGAGKDRIYGGIGEDRLNGNGGHDRLYGEASKDRLYGGDGNDTCEGGSSTDRFFGDAGNNTWFGQGGDDYFYARNTLSDTIFGQDGIDHAQIDGDDVIATVEDVIA